MNQRRESRSIVNPIIILTVVGVVLAAAVYWFLIRDDSDSKDNGTNGPAPTKTFTAPGSSFSFEYPAGFALKTDPSKGYVFIGSLGAYDLINVKRLDNKPTPVARLKSSIHRTFAKQAGTTILSEGTDNRDGVGMATIRVQSTVNGLPLTSNLYYFSANGVTWQLECEAQSFATDIDAACSKALSTFKVS